MRIMMQHARRGHAQTASARVYGPPPSNRPVATLRPRIKARTSAAAALSPGHGLQSSWRSPRSADRRPRHHLHQSPTSAPNASLATTSTRGLGSSHGRRRGQTHDRARGDLVAATGEIHVTVDTVGPLLGRQTDSTFVCGLVKRRRYNLGRWWRLGSR